MFERYSVQTVGMEKRGKEKYRDVNVPKKSGRAQEKKSVEATGCFLHLFFLLFLHTLSTCLNFNFPGCFFLSFFYYKNL